MKRHEYLALIFVILATLYVAHSDRDAAPREAADQYRSAAGLQAGRQLPGAPSSGELSASPLEPDTTRPETSGSMPAPAAGVPLPAVAAPVAVHSPAGPLPDTSTVVRGVASHVGTQFGRRYLALPQHRWGHPGIRVRICGAGACIVRVSTDAGPDKAMQRADRVADLNAWDFTTVCGCPASRGTTYVTVEYLAARYNGPLPATDVAP